MSFKTGMGSFVNGKCFCGKPGHIRECELDVALITGRAHIDCDGGGHGRYCYVSKKEVMKAIKK